MNQKCEKCGMPATHEYTDNSGTTHYFAEHHAPPGAKPIVSATKNNLASVSINQLNYKDYTPLIVIIGLITLTSVFIQFSRGNFIVSEFIIHFMTGFFLVFGGVKLFDIRAFADGYSTYDIIASRFKAYGYIYPFIEISFGFLMILGFHTIPILLAELLVMIISGIGVIIKLLKKEKFTCACLGTFLKVPLTYVTLIEDFGMAALAGLSIYFLL